MSLSNSKPQICMFHAVAIGWFPSASHILIFFHVYLNPVITCIVPNIADTNPQAVRPCFYFCSFTPRNIYSDPWCKFSFLLNTLILCGQGLSILQWYSIVPVCHWYLTGQGSFNFWKFHFCTTQQFYIYIRFHTLVLLNQQICFGRFHVTAWTAMFCDHLSMLLQKGPCCLIKSLIELIQLKQS